jgi:hypothetical protein
MLHWWNFTNFIQRHFLIIFFFFICCFFLVLKSILTDWLLINNVVFSLFRSWNITFINLIIIIRGDSRTLNPRFWLLRSSWVPSWVRIWVYKNRHLFQIFLNLLIFEILIFTIKFRFLSILIFHSLILILISPLLLDDFKMLNLKLKHFFFEVNIKTLKVIDRIQIWWKSWGFRCFRYFIFNCNIGFIYHKRFHVFIDLYGLL